MNGCPDFAWQSRFYDRIIRDEAALKVVREYILANPLLWAVGKDSPPF